jgi:hypothetical protein
MIQQVHPVWVWAARNLAAFINAREKSDRVQARRTAAGTD